MSSARQVLQLATKYRDETAANLGRLVRIPSLSGQEREVNAELARQLDAAGFDEVAIDPLGNVIGRIGSGPRVLAIDAHMDTVDVGDPANWEFDPFSGEVRGDHVLGRGSVDQEGGAAAFVTAGRIVKELGLGDRLTLLCTGTVMEEDCDGLCWKYLIEEGGLRPDFVICTEPTNLNLYRGHRGRMEMAASFRGRSAHGSAPERGVNAVYAAARACREIEQLHARLASDPFLGKGSVTVTEFRSSGPSLCAVPDSARLHLDRRLTAGETRESALAEVRALLDSDRGAVEVLHYDGVAYTGLRYGMEKYYPTWTIPADHPAVREGVTVATELFGEAPRVGRWTFSTNAIAINGLHGIPVIGFGPGDETLAHAPNEKVPVDHLVRAAAFYAHFALRLARAGS
ncbi:MAG TPA: YgeY family selenium metabolism-linked hydrolase [Candidatus Krumholzibacteria bacterium]|nr:YgeY family selenium metabolism-linked hydrolase [Candidatus Krumholzibacteria bacterium]HPD73190.1 YgeY family selenium metabolism-linked hydrolase [Candidatus Krumholzibacteria bacterium]HRY41932.1 YgeY family selenium metabolism-linked hydrolase [Candidatus Krumholzibacteria bacterium]